MMKRLLLSIFLILSCPATSWADALILKSGEVLRGEIVERNEKSYYLKLDNDGQRVEIPVAKVSIADITSPSGRMASKGSLIVFAKAGEDMTPIPSLSEQTYRPVEDPNKNSMGLFKKPGASIVSKAENTVADANARTLEAQKQLESLKAIADAANS